MHDKDMTTEGIAARALCIAVDLLEDILHGETTTHSHLIINANEQLAKLKKANKRVQDEIKLKRLV